MVEEINAEVVSLENAEIGSTVFFGSYPQTAVGNDKTPIEWKVLAKKEDKLLLISQKGLDHQQYNDRWVPITWETSSLRTWLNVTFINNAFSSNEQAMIQNTSVTADKNPSYNTPPGNNTTDKVFLLSIMEANKYFGSDNDRRCQATAYVKSQRVYINPSFGLRNWWLRSPGRSKVDAAYVDCGGSVRSGGNFVVYASNAIRPAIWVKVPT